MTTHRSSIAPVKERCKCDAWKRGMAQINAFIAFGFVHGYTYDGGAFKYCPWCGKELSEDMSYEGVYIPKP